ncbi:hypothetical protein [Larkinella humicola]|uniref:hypothetical protein n=1 Tax=Larkinella humicola TaxID=2607654 RepID=UPI00177DD2EA|nr:hypothetical protein [Larkinella humicola]
MGQRTSVGKTTNGDLHGNVPDRFPVALRLIDVINNLGFLERQRFLKPSLKAA